MPSRKDETGDSAWVSPARLVSRFGQASESSARFQLGNESDMLLIPDSETAVMDPFMETPRLVMIGDVRDPLTKQNYERDPRWIARKAELYLKNSGVGDTAYFGADAKFSISDNIRFVHNAHSGFY